MKKLTLFLSLAILVAPPIQGIPSSDCANTVRSFPINFRQGKFVGPMLLLEFRTDHTLTLEFLGLPAYPRSPGTWVLENGTLLASADFSENFRRTCAGGCAEAFQDDTPARNKELSQCTNQCVTANISRFGKQQVSPPPRQRQ